MTQTPDRKALRQQMRQQRRRLSKHEQSVAAKLLARQIQSHPLFLRSKSIAIYLANDGEIDPAQIVKLAWRQRKHCFLPVLHPIRHNRLWFFSYTQKTRLRQNIFDIAEPALRNTVRRPPWSISLIFMPLVAFDKQGGRLGMGGGFYDRTFAFAKDGSRTVRLCGLAHDFQCTAALPIETWDIPLDGIFTEKHFYPASNALKKRVSENG